MPRIGVTAPAPVATASLFQVPALVSGQWYYSSAAGNGVNGALINNTMRVHPIYWPACTFTSVGAEITVVGNAGSTLRPVIYADNGAGQPGALVVDFGTLDVATSTTVALLTGTWTLPTSGLWWFGAILQGATTTQPTVRTVSTGANAIPIPSSYGGTVPATGSSPQNCFTQSGVTGAAPGTFTVGGIGGSVPRLNLKVA